MFKIIGAIAGFFLLGRSVFGAIIGFFIGSVIDSVTTVKAHFRKGGSVEDLFNYYQQQAAQGNQNFATMLLALSASVLKADGKVSQAEVDYVKAFFARQFGPQFVTQHMQTLQHFLNAGQIPLEQICNDIRNRTQLEVRIQLLHYLFGIAKADGHVAEAEISQLSRIASALAIPVSDYESVKNMFYRDVHSDYKVLGIEHTATEEEIKKAYRQMAIRYHPDKVAQMGEEYQQGAKEKFQKVQDAYENIKKARGIS